MMQAKFMASESEKKYDEISRRLGVVQEVMSHELRIMRPMMMLELIIFVFQRFFIIIH